jgi:hypothetical protein
MRSNTVRGSTRGARWRSRSRPRFAPSPASSHRRRSPTYLVAHYFSLFVFQEQAQFDYLLTDPLGHGSSGLNPDYGVITAEEVWYVQVGALVVGHVTALTLAHDRAIAAYRDQRLAVRSQYWMLAVMVAFTCLGLFLLSQANA